MTRLLIIADDLTGANDTAVQFSKRGVPTLVTVNRDIDMASLDRQIVVLAIDTETRHASPGEAAERVATAVRRGVKNGITHFYKKIDSTLRGNIGAELEAVMTAAGHDRLMFVPAYPKAGRFTRTGQQYVGNDPVHATAFGTDPLEPVGTSFIPAIVARQSHVETVVVPRGSAQAEAALRSGRKGVYVFDCESDRDLGHIAGALADNDALAILAGSAGLAEFLPDLLDLPRKPLAPSRNQGPMLVVNGSLNELALRQAALARRSGFAEIIVPARVLLAAEVQPSRESEEIAKKAARESRRLRDVLLRSIGSREELGAYVARAGLEERDDGYARRLAARNMGRLVARTLEMGNFGSCVIFGGDTSLGVLTALGCSDLLLGEEIMPGLAVAELAPGSGSVSFITKSGGFGPENVVGRIADFLRKHALSGPSDHRSPHPGRNQHL